MGSQASNDQNNVSKLDPALNEAYRYITECLRSTSLENVYLLAGVAPPGVRTSRQERKKQPEDPRHSLCSHEPVNKCLKSRNSFVPHSVTPLDTNPPSERLRAWTHHLRSVPHKLKSIPAEDLGPGSAAPWLHWICPNRLRTGMGRLYSSTVRTLL